MPGLSHSIDIAAPPHRVWEVLADVEGWPRHIATVESVERLEPGPLALGSRTRLRQPRLPEAVWTVTELTDGRSFTWTSSSPGVVVTATHLVAPAPLGSRLDLSVSVSGALAPVGWLMTRTLSRRYVETEAASLKKAAEAG